MSVLAYFTIGNGVQALPAIRIDTTGFYIDLIGNLSFAFSANDTLKFTDSLEYKKTDKNTTANAASGFTKLIASNEGLLATINNTARSTLVGIFYPKVPKQDFTDFNLDNLVYYLNNLRHNNGTQTLNNVITAAPVSQANGYSGAIYLPLADQAVLVPYSQNNQAFIEMIIGQDGVNPGRVIQVSHTPGNNQGYIGGAYCPINQRGYYIPFAQSDQTSWQYMQDSSNIADVVEASYNPGTVLSAFSYAGGVYEPTNNRIYMAPYNAAPDVNWHYLNCATQLIAPYNPTVTNTTIAPASNRYAGSIYNSDNGLLYFVPFSPTSSGIYYAFQYVDPSNNIIGSITVNAINYPITAYAYVGGAYSSTFNALFFAPYNQLTTGYFHYYSFNDNLMHLVDMSQITNPIVTPNTYFDAVYCPSRDFIYFVPFAQGTAAYWHYIDCATGIMYEYAKVVSTVVANAYASGVYVAALDRIYLVPYNQATQAKWHYIDCATNQVIEYNNTGTGLVVAAYMGGMLFNDNIFLAPYGQSNQTTWHYIDTTTDIVVDYATGALTKYAFTGIVYNQSTRGYLTSGKTQTWYYLDCGSLPPVIQSLGTNVNTQIGADPFLGTSCLLNGYYDSVNFNVIFAPNYQTSVNLGLYYNSGPATISTYSITLTIAIPSPYIPQPFLKYTNMYSDAVNANGLVYFTPFNIPSDNTTMQYINESGVAISYVNNDYATYATTDAYCGGAYLPSLDRIYFAPYNAYDTGHLCYLDCADNKYKEVTINAPTPSTSNTGFVGAVYSNIQNKIYFIQCCTASPGLYISLDCATNTSVAITGSTIFTSYNYADGVYNPISDRVYLAPFNQTGSLHYINCATNTIVQYDNTYTAPNYSYLGGVYNPNNGRIYFSPFVISSTTDQWHYIDSSGALQTYTGFSDPGNIIPCYGGFYSADLDRIYFAPGGFYDIQTILTVGIIPDWIYLDCATDTIVVYFPDLVTAEGTIPYCGGAYNPVLNRFYLAPYENAVLPYWHYIDGATGLVVGYVPAYTAVSRAYVGAVYDSATGNIYFVPAAQSQETYWHYINSSGDVVQYLGNGDPLYVTVPNSLFGTGLGGYSGYSGGAFSPIQQRAYFAPNVYAQGNVWTYISSPSVVATQYVVDIVPPYTGTYVLRTDGAYCGAVYSAITNRIFFVPYNQATENYWHYIDGDTGEMNYYLNTAISQMVAQAYAGGCDTPNGFVFLAPHNQQNTWHYIDTINMSIVSYTGLPTELSAYLGAAYDSVYDRVYFAPFGQSVNANTAYINCATNTAVSFPMQGSLPAGAFSGAVAVNGKIYLTPGNLTTATWYYIENTTFNSYTGQTVTHGVSLDVTSPAYLFGCYQSTLQCIYMGPNTDENWYYINITIPSVLNIIDTLTIVTAGFYGAVYAPVEKCIWFVPYAQAPEAFWAYFDVDLNSVVFYTNNTTALIYAYQGGVYSPTQNRIYLVPYAQATQSTWHYIDCATKTIVSYTHGVTAVNQAYSGGVYSPTQNRIYFMPYAQSAQTTWHYVDCDTGQIIAYTALATLSSSGGVFMPTLNRLYLTPYAQASDTERYYISTSNATTSSGTLAASPLMCHF